MLVLAHMSESAGGAMNDAVERRPELCVGELLTQVCELGLVAAQLRLGLRSLA